MGTRNSRDFRGTAGWNVGVAIQHYWCHTIVSKATKEAQVSDTVEFRHHHLTLPDITPTDRIFHSATTIMHALRDAPRIACNNQLAAIQAIHQAIHQWDRTTMPFAKVPKVTKPLPIHTRRRSVLLPMRRPTTVQLHTLLPRVVIQNPNTSPSAPNIPSTKEQYEPVARRTRSKVPHIVDPPPQRVDKETDLGPIYKHTRSQNTATANIITPAQAAKQKYPAQFLQSLAMPVLKKTSGQSLQYRQLRQHPKFAHIWHTSYANELGQICQGVGKGSKGPRNQRMEGTYTFRIIIFEDITRYRRKEIFHSMVVCEVRP